MPSARSAEGGLFAASSAKRNGVAKLLACTSSQATARGLREATEALEQASTASAASELLMAFRNPAAFEHLMHLQCMVFILLVLYGILTKNDLVLIFSTINILAVFAGVAVTHAEYCENIRNF